MREFAEAWTSMMLMKGEYVHWIDGAQIQPTRIIKSFPHTFPDSKTTTRAIHR